MFERNIAGVREVTNEVKNVKIMEIIMWRSISMRAGSAGLRFDWSKAGLSMDLPVFVYSHTKTSLNFLSRQERCSGQLFMWLQICQLQTTKKKLIGLLFCLDLSLSRSIDHWDCNLHSLSYCFQSSFMQLIGLLLWLFCIWTGVTRKCRIIESYTTKKSRPQLQDW